MRRVTCLYLEDRLMEYDWSSNCLAMAFPPAGTTKRCRDFSQSCEIIWEENVTRGKQDYLSYRQLLSGNQMNLNFSKISLPLILNRNLFCLELSRIFSRQKRFCLGLSRIVSDCLETKKNVSRYWLKLINASSSDRGKAQRDHQFAKKTRNANKTGIIGRELASTKLITIYWRLSSTTNLQ